MALLSNGASRIVDPYRLADWPTTLAKTRSSAAGRVQAAPGRADIRKDLAYTLLKIGEAELTTSERLLVNPANVSFDQAVADALAHNPQIAEVQVLHKGRSWKAAEGEAVAGPSAGTRPTPSSTCAAGRSCRASTSRTPMPAPTAPPSMPSSRPARGRSSWRRWRLE
jgi:hypothetical protein